VVLLARAWKVIGTAFGIPDVPEVNRIRARSSGSIDPDLSGGKESFSTEKEFNGKEVV